MIDTVKNLIDKRNKLDPSTEEYKQLTEEIQLLQNDLVILNIMGDDYGN